MSKLNVHFHEYNMMSHLYMMYAAIISVVRKVAHMNILVLPYV